jgi:ketosteroid isomerase-like protein
MQNNADWIEIRKLIDIYSTAVTVGDLAAVASVYATDARWQVDAPFNITMTGRENIAQALGGLLETHRFVIQMLHSAVIDINGDHATAQCVVQEIAGQKDGKGGTVLYGVYDDQISRIGGIWQFTRRHFRPLLVERQAPPGTTYPQN